MRADLVFNMRLYYYSVLRYIQYCLYLLIPWVLTILLSNYCYCCGLQDNVTAFSGGCDGAVKMWNVTQGPGTAQVVGTHEQPVKSVAYSIIIVLSIR